MGYSKKTPTTTRDTISGLHHHVDISDGEHSGSELQARAEARLKSLSDAIKGDWPDGMTATNADAGHVTYGNAASRMPKPSDVSSKGGDRYGVSGTSAANPGADEKPVHSPRDNSKEPR